MKDFFFLIFLKKKYFKIPSLFFLEYEEHRWNEKIRETRFDSWVGIGDEFFFWQKKKNDLKKILCVMVCEKNYLLCREWEWFPVISVKKMENQI